MKARIEKTKTKAKGKLLEVFRPRSALNAVVLALQLLQTAADLIPVPALKTAIGGLLSVVGTLQKVKQNTEDFVELGDHLNQLNEVLRPLTRVEQPDVPWALRERIDRLAGELRQVCEEIRNVEGHRVFRRIIDASDDAQVVVRCVRKINHDINTFLVEGMIQVELGVIDILSRVNIILLDKLPRSQDCAWNSKGMDGIPMCLAGTRKGVLSEIKDWLNRPGGGVYWLTGVAGSGKTTIAYTLAKSLAKRDRLGASFFCSRDQTSRSDLKQVLPTLAYQLAVFDSSFRVEIIALLTRNADIGHLNLQGQLRELIVRPLEKHTRRETYSSVVIVIDAFDECQDAYAAQRMLEMFAESIHDLPIKFFITSRPEPHIRAAFQLDSWREAPQKLVLHEVALDLVQADISAFLQAELSKIAKVQHQYLGAVEWPDQVQVQALACKSGGLFVFAATACKFIAAIPHDPRERLELLLDVETSASAPLDGLYRIYQQIISTALPPGSSSDQYNQMRNILGTIILIFDRLTVAELSSLLGMTTGNILRLLGGLHSVVLIPEDDGMVRAFHPSWHDFLVTRTACQDERFFVDEARQHTTLALLCFQRIERARATGSRHSQNAVISRDLGYAARHWLDHAVCGVLNEDMIATLQAFDSDCVMTWLSLLSLMGCTADAIHAVKGVLLWLKGQHGQPCGLEAVLENAERLSLQFITKTLSEALSGARITTTFRQIIGAIALVEEPLTPHALDELLNLESGEVTRVLGMLSSVTTIPITDADLIEPLPQSLLKYLMDSNICRNPDLIIDPRTQHMYLALACFNHIGRRMEHWRRCQARISTIDARETIPLDLRYACVHWVSHLLQSPREPTLVTAMDNFFCQHVLYWLEVMSLLKLPSKCQHCLRLTKAWLSDFPGRGHLLEAISDTECFILTFYDAIIRHPLQVYQCLAFTPMHTILWLFHDTSHLPVRVLSGLDADWALLTKLTLRWIRIRSVAFSPDGTRIVSGSSDKMVHVWDTTTGAELKTLEGHQESVQSVSFSLDGMHIASGSADKTVRIWDATTGLGLKTLQGHWGSVQSVAFSPDCMHIVSGSADKMVCIWGIMGTKLKTLEGHWDTVESVTFSPDGMHIASGSQDMTVRTWDATTGAALKIFEGPYKSVLSVAFSPDGSCIGSGCGDGWVYIWDARKGTELNRLHGHRKSVRSVAFSPDGMRIASGSRDETVCIWDATTGTKLKVLEGHTRSLTSIAFSPNGSRIAFACDGQVLIWDATPSSQLQTREGHRDSVGSVAFSPDGRRIASGSADKTVRIWDATTGALLESFTGNLDLVQSVTFSDDGKRVVPGFDSSKPIWDIGASGALELTERDDDSNVAKGPAVSRNYRLEGEWVVDNAGKQICWVPDQYRGDVQACHGDTLVIGTLLGRVVILHVVPLYL